MVNSSGICVIEPKTNLSGAIVFRHCVCIMIKKLCVIMTTAGVKAWEMVMENTLDPAEITSKIWIYIVPTSASITVVNL